MPILCRFYENYADADFLPLLDSSSLTTLSHLIFHVILVLLLVVAFPSALQRISRTKTIDAYIWRREVRQSWNLTTLRGPFQECRVRTASTSTKARHSKPPEPISHRSLPYTAFHTVLLAQPHTKALESQENGRSWSRHDSRKIT